MAQQSGGGLELQFTIFGIKNGQNHLAESNETENKVELGTTTTSCCGEDKDMHVLMYGI